MGKDLFYTILPYLEKALSGHKRVASFKKIETGEHYFYDIKRHEKSDLRIWISDAYRFSIHDYMQRPSDIDFIYLAKPESDYNRKEVVEMAYQDGINIGKFGALMGILHVDDIQGYIPQERKDD